MEERFDNLVAFLVEAFGGFVLRERQFSKVRVEVSSFSDETTRRRLGQMFGSIEARKQELFIQDYSISQTSLEQIFNQFASQQEEELGHAAGIQ